MPKTENTAGLPAPISLTLDEARQVAAGAAGASSVGLFPWWWFGQPAAYATLGSQVTNPINVAVGQFAGFGH